MANNNSPIKKIKTYYSVSTTLITGTNKALQKKWRQTFAENPAKNVPCRLDVSFMGS